eukprot:TRINITY_DN2958_c0_g1_i4.p1 TRINITY_DN2958_c0_g1~~TRINITY_DN2958_c0_g1_i4.p1  ORF type:complete len:115 (+),score=38.14 TRINITY_DN2958_c0_g1_i4:259-603(+)
MAGRNFTQKSSDTFSLLQLGNSLEEKLLLDEIALHLPSLPPLPGEGKDSSSSYLGKTKSSKSCAQAGSSCCDRDGGDGQGTGRWCQEQLCQDQWLLGWPQGTRMSSRWGFMAAV